MILEAAAVHTFQQAARVIKNKKQLLLPSSAIIRISTI